LEAERVALEKEAKALKEEKKQLEKGQMDQKMDKAMGGMKKDD